MISAQPGQPQNTDFRPTAIMRSMVSSRTSATGSSRIHMALVANASSLPQRWRKSFATAITASRCPTSRVSRVPAAFFLPDRGDGLVDALRIEIGHSNHGAPACCGQDRRLCSG